MLFFMVHSWCSRRQLLTTVFNSRQQASGPHPTRSSVAICWRQLWRVGSRQPSRPLSGVGCHVGGGFDSHALPPSAPQTADAHAHRSSRPRLRLGRSRATHALPPLAPQTADAHAHRSSRPRLWLGRSRVTHALPPFAPQTADAHAHRSSRPRLWLGRSRVTHALPPFASDRPPRRPQSCPERLRAGLCQAEPRAIVRSPEIQWL